MLKLNLQYFGHLTRRNWLTGKNPDAGKDWGQEEKGTTEDEMVGWHRWHDGHEFEQIPAVGDGQGGLACCSPWGCKESDMTEWLNLTDLSLTWKGWSSEILNLADIHRHTDPPGTLLECRFLLRDPVISQMRDAAGPGATPGPHSQPRMELGEVPAFSPAAAWPPSFLLLFGVAWKAPDGLGQAQVVLHPKEPGPLCLKN